MENDKSVAEIINKDTVKQITPTRLFGPHDTFLSALAYSPDGKNIITGDYEGIIKVWDVESGKLRVSQRLFNNAIQQIAFGKANTPDDYRVVAISRDDLVKTFMVDANDKIHTEHALEQETFQVLGVTFSSSNRPIAACLNRSENDNRIYLLHADDKSFIKAIPLDDDDPPHIAFSTNGNWIAVDGKDGSIKIHSLKGSISTRIHTGLNGIRRSAFSPDAEHLVVLEEHGDQIKVFEIKTGQSVGQTINFPFGNHVLINNDLSIVIATSLQKGGFIHVYDLQTGLRIRSLKGSSPAALSPQHNGFACGNNYATYSKSIMLWDSRQSPQGILHKIQGPVDFVAAEAQQIQQIAVLKEHKGAVLAVEFSPDGMILTTAGEDDTIRLWSMETGEEIAIIRDHSADVTGLVFSPDGQTLASSSGYFTGHDDNTVRLWDMNQQEILVFHKHSGRVIGVQYHPGGQQIISADAKGWVLVWSVVDGDINTRIQTPSPINDFAVSPDGALIATAHGSETHLKDTVVRLWNSQTGEALREFNDLNDWILSVTFSPNGDILLVTDYSHRVVGWDIAGGQIVLDMLGGDHTIYNPHNSLLAIALDKIIKLKSVEGSTPKMQLQHGSNVTSMAFTHEGDLLAVGTRNGEVIIWGVPESSPANISTNELERQRIDHTYSGRHTLKLISITCQQAQERDGDETYLRVDGQTVWSVLRVGRKMQNPPTRLNEIETFDFSECKMLGKNGWQTTTEYSPDDFEFSGLTGPVTVELWEADSFLRGGDDYLGKVIISPAQSGQGILKAVFYADNTSYVFAYEMVSDK